MTNSIWAIVPAAGSGRRMAAETPKQYLLVNGLPILEHTLRALLACPDIRGVVVVLDPSDRRADSVASLSDPRVFKASGGAERADSVLSGLRSLTEYVSLGDWALVHDAARPCVSVSVLRELIDCALSSDTGTVLAQASTDTVKQVGSNGLVAATLDRRSIWRAQTPQMFRLSELEHALSSALESGISVTDESMAMERLGYPVSVLEGPSTNIKVTLPADLEFAEIILRRMNEESDS
ncbi:2-C-methyl-D-erythritol 4-phosphate cytidylyltransferase [Luminiphilus sp.]|nr:2-C-methyl-D-erythritol 4-phosphate cytidylyltransferase [Luminiphilus sp.]MDA8947091.1 2-C-methyl-D-erythritol 4-phosphate cytidylyltransferase [Luminiphilus sp.]MDB2378578.1 2-C-methyl-D-erythritol 4-phosphate cytidylyltransferase [Luminiphilus sp.]MDB2441594.1 2-C-methyl-D-erythritol 4-phosphate cytidylyltransferase [Luminiphilus sp.]MDB2511362.1 2-C-methyl-D-erythritol 4-phosphate cytidylyltransferase [Luminiphilus sp.]